MLLLLSVFVVVVVADQAAKALVVARLPEGAATSGAILGLRLRHVVNRRNPWGSKTAVRIMTIMWLLLVAAAWMIAALIDRPPMHVTLAGLVGGAAANCSTAFPAMQLPTSSICACGPSSTWLTPRWLAAPC